MNELYIDQELFSKNLDVLKEPERLVFIFSDVIGD